VETGVDFDARDGFLHGEDVGDAGGGFDGSDGIVAGAAAEDLAFRFVRGIAHLDAHEEAIELGFRKRISAVMLDGVLRGDYQEGLRERKRASVDGDLGLVHGFEKSRLRARSSAVDFVGEDDVGEDGSGAEFKLTGFGIVDADAEDVGGEQVGSELDALKGTVKRLGQGLRQGRFAGAGHIFDEQVTAREKGDEGELDDLFLAENGARDGAVQLRDHLRGCGRHWLKTQSLPVTNR